MEPLKLVAPLNILDMMVMALDNGKELGTVVRDVAP